MRFIVTFTSEEWSGGMEKAKAIKEKILPFRPEIEPGEIKGDYDVFIEINSLNQLMDFEKFVGKSIIINAIGRFNEIEVYDEYRE